MMPSYTSPIQISLAVSATAAVGLAVWALYRARRASKAKSWTLPEDSQFKRVGTVSYLALYPIKSCRGITIDWALCTPLGFTRALARDRVFMVTDKDGHFITARQEPKMILITPTFNLNQMQLDAPGMESLQVNCIQPQPEKGKNMVTCKIFGQLVMDTVDCGPEASQWLSTYLNREGLKLVHFGGKNSPRTYLHWDKWPTYKKTDTTVFGDLAPFLVLSKGSVDDLNSRLDNKVSAINFRPSILVEGPPAYDEENWKYVKIGDKVILRQMRPCTRCVLTTVDPETGVKDEHSEPLKTLKSYKQVTDPEKKKLEGESPVFGIYMSADIYGEIKLGDPVYACCY